MSAVLTLCTANRAGDAFGEDIFAKMKGAKR
ncbi:MAG: hypothetical protein RLZZ437_1521 [Pseudomonadota bacterium]|jgi:hypothetical protein